MNNLKLKDNDIKIPDVKKKFNKELFTIVAPSYDILTRILSFFRDKSWKKILINALPDIKKPACLDIACGTGDIAVSLLKKYPDGDIHGIDLNESMLNIARSASKTITYDLSEMEKLKFKNDTFDIITGGYALRNSWDLTGSLNEICRVLKKGGTAAFLDFSKSSNKFTAFLQLFLLGLWGSIWGLIFHKNPDIYGYIAASLKNYPDNKNMKKLLKQTGFINIKIKLLFFGFTSLIILKK